MSVEDQQGPRRAGRPRAAVAPPRRGGEAWAERVDAEGGAVHTVSVDEKPGIQAIAPTGEDRPPVAGGDARGGPATTRRDRGHGRLGTRPPVAGIDPAEGVAHPPARPTHKSSDLVDFLKALDSYYPRRDSTRPMLDDHPARTSAETQAHPDAVPGRLAFAFVPKHASRPDLVESLFGRMSRQMLRGIRVSSVAELESRIYRWFDEFNAEPSPYRWTWGIDDVDMESERPEPIGYQVVNAKACRPEGADEPAPPRPKHGPRKKLTVI